MKSTSPGVIVGVIVDVRPGVADGIEVVAGEEDIEGVPGGGVLLT